jgi:SAM-dependent methyltransferase
MLLPRSGPLHAIRAYWRGQCLGAAEALRRPDLSQHMYWVSEPERGGLRVVVPEHDADGLLQLVGERDGKPVCLLAMRFIAPHLEAYELPPSPLALRVSDVAGDAFRLSGLKGFTDLWEHVGEHRREDSRPLQVLDWGCGCGRIARYLARAEVGLHGCDIDGKAIMWCAENLPGSFQHSTTEPPLPYAAGELDVVIATSVFTHLAREQQQSWLEEIRRVLAPGGLLLASVAGRDVIQAGRSPRLRRAKSGSLPTRAVALRRTVKLMRAGIIDAHLDSHLDGIAPPGYYRMVYQTAGYTRKAWSRGFEVIRYVERGLNGHQDLVVMRRSTR